MNVQGYSPAMTAPMLGQSASPSARTMTSTSSTAASSSTSSSSSTSNGTSASDLQTMFLNLLVTELQNQDPTEPVDPTEMVSQMVSLNQLDQLISINQTLTSMAGTSTSSTSTDAAQSATTDAANPVAQASSLSQPVTAFEGAQAFTGASTPSNLMNLYSNPGASATTSNHFTAIGGR